MGNVRAHSFHILPSLISETFTLVIQSPSAPPLVYHHHHPQMPVSFEAPFSSLYRSKLTQILAKSISVIGSILRTYRCKKEKRQTSPSSTICRHSAASLDGHCCTHIVMLHLSVIDNNIVIVMEGSASRGVL